ASRRARAVAAANRIGVTATNGERPTTDGQRQPRTSAKPPERQQTCRTAGSLECHVYFRAEEHRAVVVGGRPLEQRRQVFLHAPAERRASVRDNRDRLAEIELIGRDEQRE